MESIVGKILCDRYRVIRQLSRDDFSSVFIAEDLDSPNKLQCQIERLQPHYDGEVLGAKSWQRVLKTFTVRGNILKNISQHPQIPQLLDFFECDREFFLVRELIDGESLEQKLSRTQIDETEAVNWLQEILGVLEFVHQADIFHLNIQPSSLIEDRSGKKLLTNFANVKNGILPDKQLSETLANNDFASQELREGTIDFASDLYALGKTTIYALTGQVAEQIQSNIAPSSQTGGSSPGKFPVASIKPELADLLNKMTHYSPSKRYQSASEVLAELDFSQQLVTLPPPVFTNFNFPAEPDIYNDRSSSSSSTSSFFKSAQKFIWIFLSLPFAIALAIMFIGISRNTYRNFQTYTNDNYQFDLKYPKTWAYRDLEDPITGEIVVFTSPMEDDSDLFLEKVHISIEYLTSKPVSLQEYAQTVAERIEESRGSKLEIIQDRKTKISDANAQMVVYSRQENGRQLKQMETFLIKNNQIYIAIYTAEKDKFSQFLPTVRKMLNSWEIE